MDIAPEREDDIRIHLDLYSGDTCNFNIILGHEMQKLFFLNFMNTMTFSTPIPGRPRIWPNVEEQGTTEVPDWYWWVRTDNTMMSCTAWMGNPQLEVIETEYMKHPNVIIRITEGQARRLRVAMDAAVAEMPRQFRRERWETIAEEELQPENSIVRYPVRSVKCTVVDKYRDE